MYNLLFLYQLNNWFVICLVHRLKSVSICRKGK
jgi:hypothetical protein